MEKNQEQLNEETLFLSNTRFSALEDEIQAYIDAENNVNVQDSNGNTALHLCHIKVLPLLIKAGANPFITNNNNQTPRVMAALDEDETKVDILAAYEQQCMAQEMARALGALTLMGCFIARNAGLTRDEASYIPKNTAITDTKKAAMQAIRKLNGGKPGYGE